MARLRPNSVSSGSTEMQFDCTEQSPQPSQTGGLIMTLAAGHRDGVVVEDLVGDVGLGGDRLADGENAGVEISAVAEIRKNVVLVGEGRNANPRHALAAHMGE